MNVLVVVAEMEVGGAERLLLELVAHLRRRGDAVAVVAAPGSLDGELGSLGVRRFALRDRGRRIGGALAGATVVARAVRAVDPDLVHAVNVKATAMAWLGTRLALRRVPLVAAFQGIRPADDRRAGLVLRRADRVVCVASELTARLARAGVDPARLAVVPNAVTAATPLTAARRGALDRELGLDGGPVVTAVGRLVAQKAHDRFLRAAALVAAARPDARFLLVGGGPRSRELGALARELGLGERLRLTGERPDARELIARSDVLVLTSAWEGLPLVALEALAAGTLLVAPRVQGLADVLDAGAALGLGDTEPGTVAAAVLDALAAGPPAVRRREAGRRLVAERYELGGVLAAYDREFAVALAAQSA